MNKEEKKANRMYKKVMLDTRKRFCPFRKEFQMEVLEKFLEKDYGKKQGINVLEACSGQGRLLYYLNEFDPRQRYFGFDYVREFVADANRLFKENKNIHCEYGDIYALPRRYRKKFDITILYKTLYCIPNYREALQNLFRVTKKKIYITTPLYEGDIDFEVKMYAHKMYKKGGYATYYIYGIPGFKKVCERLGAKKVSFHDMKLPFDLPKAKDPDVLHTHTIRAANGENIELTNIIKLDWKLVVIEL